MKFPKRCGKCLVGKTSVPSLSLHLVVLALSVAAAFSLATSKNATNTTYCAEFANCRGVRPMASCSLQNCVNLTDMVLKSDSQYSQLTGTIPSYLGSLTQLKSSFAVVGSDLTGTIPPSLGSLSNLQTVFEIAFMELSGTIPSSIGSLTLLGDNIGLEYLQLTGTIPSSIGSLVQVSSVVALEAMRLTGTIPASLFSITNVHDLVLLDLDLSGSIPKGLTRLTKLKRLLIANCPKMSGTLHSGLGALTDVQFGFNLGNLNLTGTLPVSLGSLESLESYGSGLILHENRLSGTIPSSLHRLTAVGNIDFNDNLLTGPLVLPCYQFNRLTYAMALTSLILSSNQLTRASLQFGDEFCVKASHLRNLDLESNNLQGTLVSTIGEFQNLESLTLGRNTFTGSVPEGVGSLTSLKALNLAHNTFTGPLPASIGSLALLTSFDISGNYFDAVLPPSICSLPTSMPGTCNMSSADNANGGKWDCSRLPCSCAEDLQVCSVGVACLDACRPLSPDAFWVVLVVIVIVVVAIVAFSSWNGARKRKLAVQQEKGRDNTLRLLQPYFDEEDLAQLLLPIGSIDFGPHSPVIATGGGGRVYKCTATSTLNRRATLQQAVALKEIYAMMDIVATSEGINEFAKELTVLMHLRHEHIVPFLGVFFHIQMHDGTPVERYFMVTQFADNGSLDQHVENDFARGPTLKQRFGWVREIALAIHYLHRENFVHRDIKLQNVLLDGGWHCLLTDFGIARSLSSTRTMTSQIGTVQYMPPEALNGMAEAPTSTPEGGVQTATLALAKSWDMYSFGLMVAALFNRQVVPFPDVDERLLIVKVLMHNLRPHLPEELSSDFHALLQTMWHTEPSMRPTFSALIDIIDNLERPFAIGLQSNASNRSSLAIEASSSSNNGYSSSSSSSAAATGTNSNSTEFARSASRKGWMGKLRASTAGSIATTHRQVSNPSFQQTETQQNGV